MSLLFLVGVEKTTDAGGVDGEECTPRDFGFRDGDKSGELATVERVRRLVAVGSSTFWV